MDMKETQTSQAKTMVVDDLQENRKAARKKRSPFSIIFEVLLYVATDGCRWQFNAGYFAKRR